MGRITSEAQEQESMPYFVDDLPFNVEKNRLKASSNDAFGPNYESPSEMQSYIISHDPIT